MYNWLSNQSSLCSQYDWNAKFCFLFSNLYLSVEKKFIFSLQHSNVKVRHSLNPRTTPTRLHEPHALVISNEHPQNSDFPRNYSRKEKKPFPIPIVELRRAARERLKKSKGQPRGRVPPPKKGLIVQCLVSLAYDVFNARIILINNLKKLLKVVTVYACG